MKISDLEIIVAPPPLKRMFRTNDAKSQKKFSPQLYPLSLSITINPSRLTFFPSHAQFRVLPPEDASRQGTFGVAPPRSGGRASLDETWQSTRLSAPVIPRLGAFQAISAGEKEGGGALPFSLEIVCPHTPARTAPCLQWWIHPWCYLSCELSLWR